MVLYFLFLNSYKFHIIFRLYMIVVVKKVSDVFKNGLVLENEHTRFLYIFYVFLGIGGFSLVLCNLLVMFNPCVICIQLWLCFAGIKA